MLCQFTRLTSFAIWNSTPCALRPSGGAYARVCATPCFPADKKMGDTGFEFVKETSWNTAVSNVCNAESNANAAGWHIPVAQDDPDLKKLIEGWSALPVEIRAGIILIASSCKSS